MANIYYGDTRIEVEDCLMKEFGSKFKEINAGGGLVRNNEGKYMMIFRRDCWDLPKGKQEEGETMEQCALREVEEETGLKNLSIGELICVTHHTYRIDEASVLKHTFWYKMDYPGKDIPVPQTEEEISTAKWCDLDEVTANARETYPSIREVLVTAGLL